jgi:hypothetical protein
MTEASNGFFAGTLDALGRFLYKLLLAIAIVWALGLIVGLFAGNPPADNGGGPPPVSSSR